jgi:hypothetical protein
MKIELYPHQIFKLDFYQLRDEATRQERIHSANRGEIDIALGVFDFFATDICPHIERDKWVFESARIFADAYVAQYFQALRLSGEQAVRYQLQLHKANDVVRETLAHFAAQGKAPKAGRVDLVKGSDFVDLILLDRLGEGDRQRVESLYRRVTQHEELQMNLTLRLILDMYETALPRVMFVARRALKTAMKLKPTSGDDLLLQPADYIEWLSNHIEPDHSIYEMLAGDKPRAFYKTSRNVASHHRGLRWRPEENLVVLEDRNNSLEVPVHEFQQRYRYLQYFCDYGIKGILASFCEKERGELSFRVCQDYDATFPSVMPNLVPRVCKPYDA